MGIMSVQVYEAIVVNSAPDGAPPGHISVYCPEIAGSEELPVTVAPLYPGWTAGGWHSQPQSVLPETESASGGDDDKVRVIIMAVTQYDLRWIGTSQYWSEITDNPTRCGARSPKGHHKVILDDDAGVQIVVSDASNTSGPKNYMSIGTNNAVVLATADGATLYMEDGVVSILNSAGDTLVLDSSNGISIVHNGGGEILALESGLAKLIGANVQIVGGVVTVVGQGGIALTNDPLTVAPTEPLVMGSTFMSALNTFLLGCIADAAMSPGVATAATVLQAQVAISIALGSPYLSTVTETA
jgi:hypothetical protein